MKNPVSVRIIWQIYSRALSFSICMTILLGACTSKKEVVLADQIYSGGHILTMLDDNRQVEAMAVKDEKIVAVGTLSEIEHYRGDSTININLDGKTLTPGFIDAHSHFVLGMSMAGMTDLNVPMDTENGTITELIAKLKSHQRENDLTKGEWILGWGYDPDLLVEKRHPNISELTDAFPDNPVFLLHISSHMAVANAMAFELANITPDTKDPEGGMLVRDSKTGKFTGLLQELAMYKMISLLPLPTPEQFGKRLLKMQALYASKGITTAQDGRTDYSAYMGIKKFAEHVDLDIDIEILANARDLDEYLDLDEFGKSINGVRISGVKLVTDGSPQGKTAFFRKPYLTEVPGCSMACRGFALTSEQELLQIMAKCYERGIQTYIHANGDAAIEMLLDGHARLIDSLQIDHETRTVIIHSQFVGRDQLERYKEYGMVPSFFTNHAFFWGDVHLENLGDERANFLSPMQTAKNMGITATNHTDYTVTPIDQMFALWTSVNRLSRNGKVIGDAERISPWDGLKAITINSAYQHKIENIKGSLEVGKFADFVIMDRNPLTIDPIMIKDIKVLETIKEGRTIYLAK